MKAQSGRCVAEAEVIVGDFLTTLLEKDTASFDTALASANTLFATPKHGELLAQCANALRPGGVLLLDVYNALPWHREEGEWQEIGGDEGEADENGEGRDGLDVGDDDYEKEDDDEDEEEAPSLLVRVQDEDGRDWRVYEHEPEVDADAQTITCTYGFKEILGEGGDDAATVDQAGRFTESLVHHYLLPEQLVRVLDEQGFVIDDIFGDFEETSFSPDESEHLVVVARRRESE